MDERPFVMVDGKKYVLADEELPENIQEPEIFQRLTDPPRSVSLSARIVLLLGGGITGSFGWIFACFGMVFCILFVPFALNNTADLTHRRFEEAGKGEVISVEKTSSKVNDQKVMRIVFRDTDGNEGRCYTHSKTFHVGDEVSLLKCAGRTKITGTRLTEMGAVMILVGGICSFFPAIGIGLVLYFFFGGLKSLHLLQEGKVGRAHFIDMAPTGASVNHQDVMKLHYKFKADDGETYDAYATALDTEQLTDDDVEPLLYDPMDPTRSVLLDGLPGKIRYDDMERTFKAISLRAILPLFFCTLFVVELVLLVVAVSVGGFLPMN